MIEKLAYLLWVWPLRCSVQFWALVISAVVVAWMVAAGRVRVQDAYLDKSGYIWFCDVLVSSDGEEVKPWLRQLSVKLGSATPSWRAGSS